MTTPPPATDLPSSLRALVNLSAVDLAYADLYLFRAEALLPSVCSKEQYRSLHHDQLRLRSITAELRQAAEQSNWAKVRSLAQEAASMRERLGAASHVLALAEAIYGPRRLHFDATTLALSGVVAQPDTNVLEARDTAVHQLRDLASHDADWESFYRSRITYFEHCHIEAGEHAGPVEDITRLRQQILTAIAADDFARIQGLTESIAADRGAPTARVRAPRPPQDRVRELAAVFPDPVLNRAVELGLSMETLPRAAGLNEYVSCCCADRATLPHQPLFDTRRSSENCTCGHACPPDVRPSLRDTLDFLMGHPFISSAGLRYLPWFGSETVLIETFSESDPDARTGLLAALGLPKRRGCARLLLEDALLTNSPRICTELGLDPAEFVVACIPFDAYVRLAPKYGWGREEFWTHLDGYQVTRELQLWALVGGNARFGGGDDLSALVRDYDPEGLTARFAILRRQRFLVRETQGGTPARLVDGE